MKEEPIKCYLCETPSVKKLSEYIDDDDPLGRSVTVECPKCKPYELDDGAQRFWFRRRDGKKLSLKCREKVKKYLKEERKKYPEKYKNNESVKITTGTMKKLCPEESINYRY